MIHKIWYFHMVIQAWSRSKCTWWISWSEEEVLRHQRRPACRTPNPSFLKSTSFFSVKAITRFFFDWISPKLEDNRSRTTARESSAEKGSKSSSDASGPVDDRGHSCKRFTRALSAVALSTWNLSCSLKEFQTVAGALLEYYEYYSGIVKMRFELQYKKEFQTWREGCWPSSADTAVVIRQ